MTKEFLDLLETRTIQLMLLALKTDRLSSGGRSIDFNKLNEEIDYIDTYLRANPLSERGF